MNEQRNLFLAIALSVLILFGFQWLFPSKPVPPAEPTQATNAAGMPPVPLSQAAVEALAPAAQQAAKAAGRADTVGASRRIAIRTDRLHGSINLMGARLDDLTLAGYRETTDPTSPEIVVLSPAGAPHPYYAEFGWVPADPTVKVPGPDSQWSSATTELGVGGQAVLTWDNGDGLRFVRTVGVDDNYMFRVQQRVENYGSRPLTLHAYALVARTGTPKTEGMYILHEGPLGVFNGTLKELKYDDLKKDGTVREKSAGGWIGITDKYWLTALIPDQKAEATGRFVHQRLDSGDRYQVDFTGAATLVPAGGSIEAAVNLFAGAKQVGLLDAYGEKLGVERFDMAIDFGWFYFLTKPLFYLIKMFHDALGNMGLAIMALTVIIKLIMFPLANKSYVAMSRMKVLQPEIQALQAKFGDDKVRVQQEMMALYKREKVNPVSGCLPMLIQIPVFFALYKVLFVTIEMRHAPFYGWIHDLSAADPTTLFNLFGLIPFDANAYLPAFMHIGVWPIIMGVTMWLQQKLNPQPADPIQAKMFMFLPFLFTFMLGQFAAGLVIYWAWSNSLSILQQWVIMRKAGVKH